MSPRAWARDPHIVERMDDPACDLEVLERTYARFGIVNPAVSGLRSIYRRWIRPRLSADRVTRMLDVGTGGGDIPKRFLAWARRDGLLLGVVAIDPDHRAIAFAGRRPAWGMELRAITTEQLAEEQERFDIVMSNHVLHHLRAPEIAALLADCERLVAPGGLVLHGDIERSRMAYAGFAALTGPFASNLLRGTFIRGDGLASIRRSWTAAELTAMVPSDWQVRRAAPFRLELIRSAGA